MDKKVKVVIIGAGSAGLSALRQVKKHTDDYVIIDPGPLGTKCARVGCMPSKVLISVGNDFHRREVLGLEGIHGGESLSVDMPAVLKHVRELRDVFSGGMVNKTLNLAGEKLVRGRAKILSKDRVQVGDDIYIADSIIIATGSRPKMLPVFEGLEDKIFTSDNIFEVEDLPGRIAVIGLGAIGLELGQALSRLGVEVCGFARSNIGQISDPEVKAAAKEILGSEFKLYLGSDIHIRRSEDSVIVKNDEVEVVVDAIIAAVGVEPDIKDLGIENLGIDLNDDGSLPFDPYSMQVGDLDVFIAGDVNGIEPILHEAVHEGSVAGINAVLGEKKSFDRKVGLSMIFTHPEIARVGLSYGQLKKENVNFVVGSVNFADDARAKVELKNNGVLSVYADSDSGRLLGAELISPDGEHLSHILALAVSAEMTIDDMLEMPFYHPTIEESLRTALLDASGKLEG